MLKRRDFLRMMAIMLVSALSVTFTSCGDDDDAVDPLNVQDAVGTWICVESHDTSYGQTYDGLLVGALITIMDNGTYTSTAPSFGENGTYVVKENTITAKNSSGDTFVVTVSVKNNRMTWEGTSSTGVNFQYIFKKV